MKEGRIIIEWTGLAGIPKGDRNMKQYEKPECDLVLFTATPVVTISELPKPGENEMPLN